MIQIENKTFTNKSELEIGKYVECIFQNCKLSDSNLGNLSFLECEFIDCDLSNCDLKNTKFMEVNFKDCKLLGIRFDTMSQFLIKLSFNGCNLNYSSFYKVNLKKTKFINCDLAEVDFTETDLKESFLESCNLKNAIFDNTNLEKADLSTSQNFVINPSQNRIKKAKFSKENLAGLLSDFDIVISQ